MKTVKGIELDLRQSNFIYNYSGLSFFFSSKFYLEKFADNVQNYVIEETAKIRNKYNMNFNFDLFLMIAYYKKIEKRGFRILKQDTNKEIMQNDVIINQLI